MDDLTDRLRETWDPISQKMQNALGNEAADRIQELEERIADLERSQETV